MKMILMNAAAVCVLAVAATAMSAQTEMDTNGDGFLSQDELLAAYPSMTEQDFAAVDADADGAVSLDEMKAAEEAGLLPTES